MPRNISFEEWKKKKMETGEWLSTEEYQRKKDMERKEYLEKELRIVNLRLNPRNHNELKKEFVQYFQDNENIKIESESESDSSQKCGGGVVVVSKKRKSERNNWIDQRGCNCWNFYAGVGGWYQNWT